MDWALIQGSYDAMNSLEDAILKSHSSSDLILGAESVISHMIKYHTSQEFLTWPLPCNLHNKDTFDHKELFQINKLSLEKNFDGEKYTLSLNREICLTIRT